MREGFDNGLRLAGLRRLRRYFAGPRWEKLPGDDGKLPSVAERPGPENTLQRQTRQYAAAQTIVRCFYAFALYYAVTQCVEFAGLTRRANFSPLWPLAWMNPLSAGSRPAAIGAVAGFYLLASIAGTFFASSRVARVFVFVGMLEYFALRNTFGKIGHSSHLFILVALLLVLLPSGWHRPAALVSRLVRQETLLVFWFCQATILLTYSMSGLGKLGYALYQMALGQPNAFSPGALGAHIALRLLQTNTHSALADFIIGHPYLTWPLMPFPIYLELFAFWIAFRPAVQRWWALVLVLFHVGTIFTLNISFPLACLLLALFFFQSPFQPLTVRWREIVVGLPLLGEMMILPSVLRRKRELRMANASSSLMISSPTRPLSEGRKAPRF